MQTVDILVRHVAKFVRIHFWLSSLICPRTRVNNIRHIRTWNKYTILQWQSYLFLIFKCYLWKKPVINLRTRSLRVISVWSKQQGRQLCTSCPLMTDMVMLQILNQKFSRQILLECLRNRFSHIAWDTLLEQSCIDSSISYLRSQNTS